MKVFCNKHGAHFPEEFEFTIKENCTFWGELGLKRMPKKYKKMIWDYTFALPADEIWLKTGFIVKVGISAVYAPKAKGAFEDHEGYKQMTETERQQYQRELFYKKAHPIKSFLKGLIR